MKHTQMNGKLDLVVSYQEIIDSCGIENFLSECPNHFKSMYSKYNTYTNFVISLDSAKRLGILKDDHVFKF